MDQNNPVVSIFPRDPEDFSDKTRIKTVEDRLKVLEDKIGNIAKLYSRVLREVFKVDDGSM